MEAPVRLKIAYVPTLIKTELNACANYYSRGMVVKSCKRDATLRSKKRRTRSGIIHGTSGSGRHTHFSGKRERESITVMCMCVCVCVCEGCACMCAHCARLPTGVPT